MKTRIYPYYASVCTLALILASGAAVAAGTPAPLVSGGGQVLTSPALGALEQAAFSLKAGKAEAALAAYKRVLNDPEETVRAQARLGAAYALSALGDDAQALRMLEGTVTDASPLGEALGIVRANLYLQLTEKALFEGDEATAVGMLNTFERLTLKTDHTRYERLKAMVAGQASGAIKPLKVGVILPFTGDIAQVSENILMGLQIGLAEGYAPAKRVGAEAVVLPFNSAGEGGISAALKAAAAAGVDVLVGPLLSKDVEAAASATQSGALTGVPVLSLSSDRGSAGSGVHALNYVPAGQASAIAQYALAQNKTRVAALVPNTPYGTDVLEAFRQTLDNAGVSLVAHSFYNPAEVDISASIRELVGTAGGAPKFDALLLPAAASSLPLIAGQLAYYDINPRNVLLLGTGAWQHTSLLASSASAVRGGVFSVPPRVDAFNSQFEREFGKQPHPLALVGYDAGKLVSQLAAEQILLKKEVRNLLLRAEGFAASGGFVSFRPSGQTERGLATVRVGSGQFETITPALTQKPLELPTDLLPKSEGRNWKLW